MSLRNLHEVKPAYICNGDPIEAAQFYAIACDPKRSVAIEACAGAGKTWMLVSRILRALLDGTKPEAILAITYTKKAAGEMRERLFEWLYSFAQENSHEKLLQELIARGVSENEAPLLLPRLKKLHEELLTHSREVEIRTFHSWFAQLLGAAPLGVLHELGLPVQYELIEDDSELFPQTWQALLRKSLHDNTLKEDLNIIMQELGVFSAQEALRAAWGKRVEFMLADAQGVIDSSVRAVPDPGGLLMESTFVSRWLGYAKTLGEQNQKTPQKAASALEYALTSISSPKERLQTLRNALFVKAEDRLSTNLVKFEVAQQAEMELVELLEQTRQHQAYLYQQRMGRLTRNLLAVYAELKREQNIVDMADLERVALRLLGDTETYGWVAQRLDAQIRQVLIDEFQDTNPLQWQALKSWLSAYAGTGGGGRMSIFIVGDPKQSIYRFRRADPAVFMAACSFLQNVLGGSKLACDHTRRNAKEVIQSVNTVFLQAQSQLQYQNFRPHTTASEETGLVTRLPMVERLPKTKEVDQEQDTKWRDSLTEPHRFEEEKLRTKEVYQVAALIEQWVEKDGWQPSDIKVLSRRKERLRELLSELNAKRIPWRFADDIHLIETMEVRDIVALLDILASPIHDLLLAQVLRSPIFGLDDRDLMFLAQRVRRLSNEDSNYVTRYWWDVLISAADANDTGESIFEWPKTLIQASKQLKTWKMLSKTLPPHDLLDRIYHEGNILQRYGTTVPVAMRESVIANLNAFLQQALMLDGGRYATPYNLVRAMRRQHIKSEFPETNDAVELLTIHGAKGLEAKGVIILDTDPPSTRTERLSVLMNWPAEENWPTQFIFYTSQKNLPSNIQYLAAQESAANHREELNALYVAMTRAREKLVFSALQSSSVTTQTTPSWWHRLDNVENVLELEDKTNFFSSHTPYTEKRFVQDLINTGPKASAAAFEPFFQLVLPTYTITKEAEQQHSDIFDVLKAQTGELGISRNTQTSLLSEQTQAQRFGNAVHRLLELERFDEETLNNIATETGLPTLQIAKAAEKAKTMMMHPQTSIFFDASKIEAVQKEIELFYQNELLRIDRLVKVKGQWWILDYKSSAIPDIKFEQTYQEQLAKYKKAIQAIMPGEEIHIALITGAGDLIKL